MQLHKKGTVVKILHNGMKHYAVVSGVETQNDELYLKLRTVTFDPEGKGSPIVLEKTMAADEVRETRDHQESTVFAFLRQMVGVSLEKTTAKPVKVLGTLGSNHDDDANDDE